MRTTWPVAWHGPFVATLFALWAVTAVAAESGPPSAGAIDYNRQIRPLLSNHCFKCHGPDAEQRKGGFRLDVRESALGEAESGSRPILPDEPGKSELVRRINEADTDQRMPPAAENKPLSAEQKELLSRWIAEGAKYQTHWAFTRPRLPPIPTVRDKGWPRGEIDSFVLSRLEREGLVPSPAADKPTFVRRLLLDLTGLP